jgi:hypothetical protein
MPVTLGRTRYFLGGDVETGKQSGVFINYRRSDTGWVAQALRQSLVQALSAEQVFMDISDLAPGVAFAEEIDRRLLSSSVLIAIIGPTWLGTANEMGQRRLDDPTDLVRGEIASALENGVKVVPVLVDRTPMPKPEFLPENLRARPEDC